MSRRAYIKHIVSTYPENVEYNATEGRLIQKIGIIKRHIAQPNECASDFAVKAADSLFHKHKINRRNIDALIFCTQTPDYLLPATACVIHGRLGLSNNCLSFDLNQGCAGYIYGLSLAKGLIETEQADNVLLLTSDTISKIIHPKDMRTRPLFGDSAAATLISSTSSRQEFLSDFRFGTSGQDFRKLIVHYGGMRMRNVDQAVAYSEAVDNYGNVRTDAHLYMDGKEVIRFTVDTLAPMMEDILEKARLSRDDVSNFIFHQANKFVLDKLRIACGIPDDGRFYNDCSEIGNTTSASIPNAINQMQRKDIVLGKHCLLMGFGSGFSWGGCMVDLTTLDENL